MLKINGADQIGKQKIDPNRKYGFNNDVCEEPYNDFVYNTAPCETVYKGQNNAYIVFGRDRFSDWNSGYGGKGHGKDSALDIVVGRLSSVDATTLINQYVNPNYAADASRIYISQKTDIDDNFGIVEGYSGKSVARAGIAVKSDDVRIIARNSMKLVVNSGEKTSTDDPIISFNGVELLNNMDNTEPQPIPLGNNLVAVLKDVLDRIHELNGVVTGFMEEQSRFNKKIMNHTHLSPFFAAPTSPDPELIKTGMEVALAMNLKVEQQLKLIVNNIVSTQSRYLNAEGGLYINSSYHKLN